MKNYLFIFALIVCVLGCSTHSGVFRNDDLTPATRTLKTYDSVLDSIVVTNDGALKFLTPSVYFAVVDSLLTFSEQELDNWEKSIGFSSMRKAVNDVMDLIYESTSEADVINIINSNNDVVKGGGKILSPLIGAKFYRNILNRHGDFYVGDIKYHVSPENVVIINAKAKGYEIAVDSFSYYDKESSDMSNIVSTRYPGVQGYKFGPLEGWINTTLMYPGKIETVNLETTYKLYRNNLKYTYYPDGIVVGNILYQYIVKWNHYLQIDIYSYHYSNNRWSIWPQKMCFENCFFKTSLKDDDNGSEIWDENYTHLGILFDYQYHTTTTIPVVNFQQGSHRPDYNMMTLQKIGYRVRYSDLACGIAVAYNYNISNCQ